MITAKILKAIRANKTFLISTHVNPDPDALTSELAMAHYLQSLHKKVYVVNEAAVPERLRFLPWSGAIQEVAEFAAIDYDAAIIVDCGDLDRIGSVKKFIAADKLLINIDHHITSDFFGDVNLVFPQASSTAEVIYQFLTRAKFRLDKNVAALLYIGIMTDTGSFRYENTSAQTHQVVGRLLEFGISTNELYKKLYESVPANDLKYFTQLVSAFEAREDGKIILLELKKPVVKRFSEEFDLRDKIFRYLRALKGVEVIVILTEQSPAETRVNLRSQGKLDVARLAMKFNGGGHRKASGCMLSLPMSAAKLKILREIKKAL